MWYINSWIESLVLRRKARDFFPYLRREDGMKKAGFYIIKDKFFEDTNTGTYWMISFSSRIEFGGGCF